MRAALDGALFALANYWTAGLSMVANLVARKFVTPAAFGATAYARGIYQYIESYNKVYRNAIEREVPVRRACGEWQNAEVVLHTAYTLLLASVLIESVITIGVSLLISNIYLRLALIAITLIQVFDGIGAVDRSTLQASIRFRALSLGLLVTGSLGATLMILFSWLWGFYGYFLALSLSGVAKFMVFRLALGMGWRAYLSGKVDWRIARSVIGVGAGISLFFLAQQALFTADRFFIGGLLSITDLGYYSLGISITSTISRLTASLAAGYSPRMMGLLGSGQLKSARMAAQKLQVSIVLMLVLTFSGLALAIRLLTNYWLKEYASTVPALDLMFIGGYFLGAQAMAAQLHVGLLRLRQATLVSIAAAGMAVLLDFLSVPWGLVGIAGATTTAFGAYTLTLNWRGEQLVRGQGLVWWTLVGLVLLAGTYGFLYTAGWVITLLYLLGLAAGIPWYLGRLHQLRWRQLPAMLYDYFSGREGMAAGSKQTMFPPMTHDL